MVSLFYFYTFKPPSMNKWIQLFFVATVFAGCTTQKDYNPDTHLSILEKDKVMTAVIRYLAKPPEGYEKERFDKKHDAYYLEVAGRHKIVNYYIDSKGVNYFLISRPAPSLVEKRVATGGKVKFDKDWNLIEYEEVFRTWKMKEDELNKKGLLVFDLMVNSQPLEPYQMPTSKEEYIEFPDERTYYDKVSRSWKVR